MIRKAWCGHLCPEEMARVGMRDGLKVWLCPECAPPLPPPTERQLWEMDEAERARVERKHGLDMAFGTDLPIGGGYM